MSGTGMCHHRIKKGDVILYSPWSDMLYEDYLKRTRQYEFALRLLNEQEKPPHDYSI